ncbi:hypothetical protein HME9302_02075 [Alteripontixanthobacter maritimus]|uniref:HTH tetR-type domain-containing protein n=1 Tax=Alteripontixanthobacter maritimus TaxID=2161824 RepID=A0A369QD67_9SPHN|nr:TetR/AcrR family transcriptional regulator [Alteripontixanthobacter maritimus]RDC60859.1 hypothetical protein HME9302_02075 [Alteripontixanthobacter maritimus]
MRARLIKEARHLFGRQGYSATSQAEICAAAEVSRGALNYHFDGKKDLFEAVVENVLSSFRDWGDDRDLREELEHYFRTALDPEIFSITIRDAPAVLGIQTWRDIELAHFVEPMVARGLEPLSARMVYGALLEATIAAFSANDREDTISRALLLVERIIHAWND